MRVQLLVTCLCDAVYPDVAVSTVRLLRRLGVDVDFLPDQLCCGQPAYNAGYPEEARRVAAHMIRVFETDPEAMVVTPSGSCAAMIRHHYARMFAGDPNSAERSAAFAGRVYELSEFIVRVLRRADLGGRYDGTVSYHQSCHMTRLIGLRDEPLTLLRNIQGLTLLEMPYADECCGFGGMFSATMPDIATAIVDAKINHFRQTGAHTLVGADMGCLMHIEGRLSRLGVEVEALHLAQLLERALAQAEQGVRP